MCVISIGCVSGTPSPVWANILNGGKFLGHSLEWFDEGTLFANRTDSPIEHFTF